MYNTCRVLTRSCPNTQQSKVGGQGIGGVAGDPPPQNIIIYKYKLAVSQCISEKVPTGIKKGTPSWPEDTPKVTQGATDTFQ